jgi:hypothetical protein
VTLDRIETNGRASVLIPRGGAVIALTRVTASAQDIDQLMWKLRPSELAALSPPAEPSSSDRTPG